MNSPADARGRRGNSAGWTSSNGMPGNRSGSFFSGHEIKPKLCSNYSMATLRMPGLMDSTGFSTQEPGWNCRQQDQSGKNNLNQSIWKTFFGYSRY